MVAAFKLLKLPKYKVNIDHKGKKLQCNPTVVNRNGGAEEFVFFLFTNYRRAPGFLI